MAFRTVVACYEQSVSPSSGSGVSVNQLKTKPKISQAKLTRGTGKNILVRQNHIFTDYSCPTFVNFSKHMSGEFISEGSAARIHRLPHDQRCCQHTHGPLCTRGRQGLGTRALLGSHPSDSHTWDRKLALAKLRLNCLSPRGWFNFEPCCFRERRLPHWTSL